MDTTDELPMAAATKSAPASSPKAAAAEQVKFSKSLLESKMKKLCEVLKQKHKSHPDKETIVRVMSYIVHLNKKSHLDEHGTELADLIQPWEKSIQHGSFGFVEALKIVKYFKAQSSTLSPSASQDETMKPSSSTTMTLPEDNRKHETPAKSQSPSVAKSRDKSVHKTIDAKRESNKAPTTSKMVADEDRGEARDESQILSNEEDKILDRIIKLDEFCQKISKQISEYETKEIDLNEMDLDLTYHTEADLKERFTKAHDKLIKLMKKYPHLVDVDQKLVKPHNKSVFGSKIKFTNTRYKEINEKITKQLKKLTNAPTYDEVKAWISDTNNYHGLGLSDDQISQLTLDSMKEIVPILKKKRSSALKQIQSTRLQTLGLIDSDNNDPALVDKDLEQKLESHKRIAEENLDKLFSDYSLKQDLNPEACDEESCDNFNDDEDEDEEENVVENDGMSVDNDESKSVEEEGKDSRDDKVADREESVNEEAKKNASKSTEQERSASKTTERIDETASSVDVKRNSSITQAELSLMVDTENASFNTTSDSMSKSRGQSIIFSSGSAMANRKKRSLDDSESERNTNDYCDSNGTINEDTLSSSIEPHNEPVNQLKKERASVASAALLSEDEARPKRVKAQPIVTPSSSVKSNVNIIKKPASQMKKPEASKSKIPTTASASQEECIVLD